jgi:hypothetical protein
MAHSEQRISVTPGTLPNLIIDVSRGNYRIPQFQREFVWTKAKIIELLDSIYNEFPIGSFFLWKAHREDNHLFRHTLALDIPPVGDHDTVYFILDGQQRITSLYVTLMGLTVTQTDGRTVDYGQISFDLKEEKFTDRKGDERRYVPVWKIWSPDSMLLSRSIDKEFVAAFDRCWKTFQTYPISIVEVRDKDLPAVCKIFRRINQGGKRLDRFDLVSAMTFTTEFDLRERVRHDLQSKLEAKHFGKISRSSVVQLLALLKSGQCTERHEFDLTTHDIREHWQEAITSILLAADTLRKIVGVVNYRFLPYDAILTLLAYYFAKSKNRSLPADHVEWVSRWFWRASFSQRYGSGGPTRIGQDRELFDALMEGHGPDFSPTRQLTPASLAKVRMTQTGSALRNAFLCLLAVQKPVHLVNNTPLDLIDGGISDFTSPEKHHIFPHAYLERSGLLGADSYSLPNFCFIPAELNKEISSSDPAEYFADLRSQNSQLEGAADTHLIPLGTASGIEENDYLTFLNARAKRIIDEVGRLCGEITTPKDDERQARINELEDRLRDCIDAVLTDVFGRGYWKSKIPSVVRDNAEKRIQDALGKNPELTDGDFAQPRSRLNYCNVMDYCTIIENGSNWPSFERTFRKKQDIQTYLANFSNYRNSVAHNRAMTELERKLGETALLWLSLVLPSDSDGPTEEMVDT